jgi:flavin reductase (DIM6/NTAB) family NADH-FMN oxidoreductase RutF
MKIKKTSAWITDGVVDGKPMKKPLWHFLVEIEDYHYRKQKDGSHKLLGRRRNCHITGD